MFSINVEKKNLIQHIVITVTNIELTSYCNNDILVQGGIIVRPMDCRTKEYLLCEKGVHQLKSHGCWLVGSLCVIKIVSGHPNTTISAQQDCVIL